MDINRLYSLDATPEAAADLLHSEITQASVDSEDGGLLASVNGFARALGLGLQLGPAATEQVLTAILQACRESAAREDSVSDKGAVSDAPQALSTLGPAIVELVGEVQCAGVLPGTPVMEAWATLASELGLLIGQMGLALAIPAEHRAGMVDSARTRALLLDDATGGRFALVAWLEEVGCATDLSARQGFGAESCAQTEARSP
jgi:hypothetical protein